VPIEAPVVVSKRLAEEDDGVNWAGNVMVTPLGATPDKPDVVVKETVYAVAAPAALLGPVMVTVVSVTEVRPSMT
jgi:hypothetical protein